MFYYNYVNKCNEKGVSPTAAAIDMGFNRSMVTRWGNGVNPRQATLQKIADYFGCTVAEWTGAESYTKRGTANAAPLLLHFDFDFFSLSAKRDDLRSVGRWQKHLLCRIAAITQPACSNYHLERLHRHSVVAWVNFDFRRL